MSSPARAPSKAPYHHGDLRHALLQAALGLVAKVGVEGFSLREAAREVGVSPAAAYRHFEDKAALMAALALEGMARLAQAMERAVARVQGTPGSAARAAAELGAVGEAYVEFAVRHSAHFRVMFGPWCPEDALEALAPEARPEGRDPYQILVEALDALVASGAVTPAARAGAEIAAWSSVHGLASLLVSESLPLGAAERAQALGLIQRTLLLGLGCAPELLGPPAEPLEVDEALCPVRRGGKAERGGRR
jgi:AcrR family transcriptional regulator